MNFTLQLPQPFRAVEVLAFHWRDEPQQAAVPGRDFIRKLFLLQGTPVALEIHLRNGQAACRAEIDGSLAPAAGRALKQIARNLLGLGIDPAEFEGSVADDPLLGQIVREQSGLRIPQSATPFDALAWAIIGQQVNLAFAIALRQELIAVASIRHSAGGWCHPGPEQVARIDPAVLTQRRFSGAKAETVVRVARLIVDGELDLEQLAAFPPDEAKRVLTSIKRIGPWTANYLLLRGFGAADCCLSGDAAVRTALRELSGSLTRIEAAQAELQLRAYQPWRSLAAAHLWASLARSKAAQVAGNQ